MGMWLYTPVSRVTPTQASKLAVVRKCTACDGNLLRLAERAWTKPYKWVPMGFICDKCNTVYMDLQPSSLMQRRLPNFGERI